MIMSYNPKLVGERLEKVRETLLLQKGEFSVSFGVDPSSYSKIAKGEKPLKAEMAYEISQKWGVTMDYLYRGLIHGLPDDLARSLRTN